jgi:hypothetical protein
MDIGNTLRDARRRRELALPECETATRIRGRYLTALEEERFELLPEPAYAKGFLRTYAEFLGLDPRPLLDELDERLNAAGTDEPPRMTPVRIRQPRRPRRGRHPVRLAMLLAGGIAAVAAAVWAGGRETPDPGLSVALPVVTTAPRDVRPPPTTSAADPVSQAPAVARLRLTGRPPAGSWVQVRRSGPEGPVLFEGTIGAGAERVFRLGRVWMRVGWGAALEVSVAGRVQELPEGTAEVTVTRAGIVG